MVTKISDADYKLINLYVRTVLQRAGVAEDRLSGSLEDLMHPLTALLDNGVSSQEFVPYMKMMLANWKGDNAPRS